MCRPLLHVLLIHAFKTNYIIISITFLLFQLFTIYSAVSIIILLVKIGQLGGPVGGSAIGVVIYTVAIFALANALGYYLWEIVKSAYKQIKEENENVQPPGNYKMNTYEKLPPAQYNHCGSNIKIDPFSNGSILNIIEPQ